MCTTVGTGRAYPRPSGADAAGRAGDGYDRRPIGMAGEPSTPRGVNAIFQQPWWLDAVAPGRWGEATVERDGRVIARLPYVARGPRRLRILTMPPLTQTLGPWIERSGAKPVRALGHEIEVLGALEAVVPEAAVFLQHFSPTMLNAMPFLWAGYRVELRYTYRLDDLGSEEALWDGLSGKTRTEIRKARDQLQVRDDLGLDRFYAVWGKTFARQGLAPPVAYTQLERLDAACAARDARALLFACDDADRVHAVACVVWDAGTSYYLLAGADPALRSSGASSLLMWESIVRARDVSSVFDFEGSILKPVERVFRSFGSRQTPYLRVSRASRVAGAALALRARSSQLGRRRGASRSR